jgi:hypothetical protein
MAKKKIQNVAFKSVDEFFDFLPLDESEVVHCLRNLVLDCIPGIKEKLAYNVPFYSINKNICFIWPASVLWGKQPSYTGVRFGFNFGYLLHDEQGHLEKGNRKQVSWKEFNSMKEIDAEILRFFLFEAAAIDQEMSKAYSKKS